VVDGDVNVVDGFVVEVAVEDAVAIVVLGLVTVVGGTIVVA
jgi:hypothetical protein